jgi:hypothetical protein
MIFSSMLLSALLRSSDPERLIPWCVIGICAGIYLFIQGFRLLQRRNLILNTPVSKIRSASLGLIELNGLAVGPYTLTAPITARSCYYYRTLVWEWKQRGKNKQWVKAAAECMHVPFFLDDNTGKVMVDPRGADLDLHRDFQQEFCDSFFTTREEVPPNVRMLLSRHGINTTNKIKVEEYCIKPKNSLFMLGTLDENPGLELAPQPIHDAETVMSFSDTLSFSMAGTSLSLKIGSGSGFSGSTSALRLGTEDLASFASSSSPSPAVVRLPPASGPTKTADMTQQQKVSAALLKAGILNPAAWAAAGVPSAASASPDPNAPLNNFELRPPVVLMKGKNNPTFLISWRSQRDLASSLGWKCTAMIWGGPALTLLGLYGLLALTHLL